MAKATIDDVKDLGFQAASFGLQDDWDIDNASGYLQKIIDDMGTEVRNHVTAAVYDSAENGESNTDEEKQNFITIKKAELNLVASELWSRRIIYLENSTGRSIENIDELMAEYRKNAVSREEKAWNGLAFLTGHQRNGSFSTGVVESGAYPLTT